MFQPTTSELGPQDAPPERETVIKFVISGPYLNAEAAHTQWSAEPPPQASAMQELMRRISDLERKLDEERALVHMLSRQMPAGLAPEPVAAPWNEGAPLAAPPLERAPTAAPHEHERAPTAAPHEHERATLAEPAPVIAPEPVVAPGQRYSFEPVVKPAAEPVAQPTFLAAVQTAAEDAARTVAEPAAPESPLSTVAHTPPPKVRGLRRMIGALRRL